MQTLNIGPQARRDSKRRKLSKEEKANLARALTLRRFIKDAFADAARKARAGDSSTYQSRMNSCVRMVQK